LKPSGPGAAPSFARMPGPTFESARPSCIAPSNVSVEVGRKTPARPTLVEGRGRGRGWGDGLRKERQWGGGEGAPD
jgi:hypothetical protein